MKKILVVTLLSLILFSCGNENEDIKNIQYSSNGIGTGGTNGGGGEGIGSR